MLFLIVAFLAGSLIMIHLAEDPTLADRWWVNHLADKSRKGFKSRRGLKYAKVGIRFK